MLGQEPLDANINLALFVASNALMDKVQWSGEDYMEHPLFVAMKDTSSTAKQIIGILHDVVEDSDWTLKDLEDLGFSQRVVKGVDGVTKRPGEGYFEFIVRCGQSGEDAIDVKLKDLNHNSQNTRTPIVDKDEKKLLKSDVYNICNFYLVGIKKGDVAPGTSVEDFVDNHPNYAANSDYIKNRLMPYFSGAAQGQTPQTQSGIIQYGPGHFGGTM